jgi:hypothetical protein
MFISSAPKHRSFLDSSSLLNPPPFIIEIIITSVRLLELNPSTIRSTHYVGMDTYPITIIYGCHFITRTCQELGRLYGLDSGFLDLLIHKFSKCSVSKSDQSMFRLLGTFKLANKSYIVSYSSIGWPWERIWIMGLNWTIFWFPSLGGLLICCRIEFGPCWAHNHIFSNGHNPWQCIPPLFSPQVKVSHELQSYDQHVWLEYPICIWLFSPCFQSRSKLCTSQFR